ncbi:MAG: MBL fold metallo-hydrolase [Cyanobacteria bacterium J06642_11]
MLDQIRFRQTLLTVLLVVAFTTALLLDTRPTLSLLPVQATEMQVQLTNALANDGEVTIHQYSAPPHDQVNSYWLETNNGVIIIDAQRFLSQARYLAKEIRTVTDKPLLGIFVTHHHTDHIGGLPALIEELGPNVSIYASQFVRDDIETDGSGFLARRKELHGNDFPAPGDIPLPDQIVTEGDTIELDGLTFEVIEFRDNETPVSTIYYLPEQNALFVGDFVTNQRVPFLRNGYSENWITQLQLLIERYPDQMVYSGHGEPDLARQLVEAEIEYIETVRGLVTDALSTDSEITAEEKSSILIEMEAQFPNYQSPLLAPGLIEANIDAVAEELQRQS